MVTLPPIRLLYQRIRLLLRWFTDHGSVIDPRRSAHDDEIDITDTLCQIFVWMLADELRVATDDQMLILQQRAAGSAAGPHRIARVNHPQCVFHGW